MAVTIDGDLATFYVNGQLSGLPNQDRGNAIDNTATGVSIGREQYAGSLPAGRWFFNGLMDDVRIYARALLQAEIQSVMTGPRPTPPRITTFVLSGSTLVFGGTNGVPGRDYYILTTTNVALPLSAWVRVGTNRFSASGGFSSPTP